MLGKEVVHSIYVIEFQKRGLPHAHIVVKFASSYPKNVDEINNVIHAEISREQGRLQDLVKAFMIHEHSSVCKNPRTGHLRCRLPDKLSPTPFVNAAGYVSLRRREEQDRCVANYNPALLMIAECHVHIKISETINVIEYMFNYMFKKPEQIHVENISVKETKSLENMPPIDRQLVGSYVSAGEAMWQILGYHTCRKEPAVLTLHVHEQGQYSLRYQPGNEHEISSKLSLLDRWIFRPKDPLFDKIR